MACTDERIREWCDNADAMRGRVGPAAQESVRKGERACGEGERACGEGERECGEGERACDRRQRGRALRQPGLAARQRMAGGGYLRTKTTN
jgi:hypothetical protein